MARLVRVIVLEGGGIATRCRKDAPHLAVEWQGVPVEDARARLEELDLRSIEGSGGHADVPSSAD